MAAQGFQEREVKPYSKLRIFGNIQAVLITGKPKVMIETKNIDPDNITTEVKNEELEVKMRKNLFKEDKKVFVKIFFQDLDELTTLADAEVDVEDPLVQPVFDLKATSGSHVKMIIESQNLNVKAYQGGQGEIKGKTDTLDAYVNTGGILSATDLIVQNANINMNTGGKGEITVRKKLEARINTGADFSYFGKPESKDINTSLGGTISSWDEK
jgi:hypothetical protein